MHEGFFSFNYTKTLLVKFYYNKKKSRDIIAIFSRDSHDRYTATCSSKIGFYSGGTCDEFDFCNVFLSEIEFAIHNLKNNKIDCDCISTNIIKQMSYFLSPILFKSFKIPFYFQYPKYYRPIAIQPKFSKLFEKIMLFQLNYFLSEKSIINSHQHGFR